VFVSLEKLKVTLEPQSPVMHLYSASSSGSREQDLAVLRRIVSLVSFDLFFLFLPVALTLLVASTKLIDVELG